MNRQFFILLLSLLLYCTFFSSCEGGLEPPPVEPDPTGVIKGVVTYSGTWPSADSLKDLRFVPLKSPPQTPADILSDTDNLVFSERLNYFAEQDTFLVKDVRSGVYTYNTIAQRISDSLLDWRPVGLYKENNGIIIVNNDTVSISIHVDFDNLPPFPPE